MKGPQLVPLKPKVDEARVRDYLPLVLSIAKRVSSKLPVSVEIDDLVQEGRIGLMEALSRYEPGRGVAFEVYATPRIRGAMFSSCRRRNYQYEWHEELSMEVSDSSPGVEEGIEERQRQAALSRALGRIPALDRRVLKMYSEGKTYFEIGASVGRSTTWAYYRVKAALDLMRADTQLRKLVA